MTGPATGPEAVIAYLLVQGLLLLAMAGVGLYYATFGREAELRERQQYADEVRAGHHQHWLEW